ncbi:MAG: hypothetical protein IJG82_10620, partial [Atopobiaceae bacterium]|nr:hypothetical protein [Atopobiaceae bacterium]
NALLEVRELYGLCILGEQILHTAHEVKTAAVAFRRLASFFENKEQYPELAELCDSVRRTNGQEAIYLTNGASIQFAARSRGANRGFTYDLVAFDEAQELTDEQQEAILSTMAAAPSGNRQLIYMGTPPGPRSPGEVFPRVRKSALSGEERSLCWHEWSVEEVGNVADRSRWYETNPALGIRLDESFTETERLRMTPEGFARERLGWWSDFATVRAVFGAAEWEKCRTMTPPCPKEDEKICYGVKFTPDDAEVAISVATMQKGIPIHVECTEFRSMSDGIAWVSSWLVGRKEKCSAAMIDGRANAAALEQRLIDDGFPKRAIMVTRTQDAMAAAITFRDAVRNGDVTHFGQEALTNSALSAQKRSIGNEGGWGFGSGRFSCAPVESCALAYYAVKTTKRHAGRKQRMIR